MAQIVTYTLIQSRAVKLFDSILFFWFDSKTYSVLLGHDSRLLLFPCQPRAPNSPSRRNTQHSAIVANANRAATPPQATHTLALADLLGRNHSNRCCRHDRRDHRVSEMGISLRRAASLSWSLTCTRESILTASGVKPVCDFRPCCPPLAGLYFILVCNLQNLTVSQNNSIRVISMGYSL